MPEGYDVSCRLVNIFLCVIHRDRNPTICEHFIMPFGLKMLMSYESLATFAGRSSLKDGTLLVNTVSFIWHGFIMVRSLTMFDILVHLHV